MAVHRCDHLDKEMQLEEVKAAAGKEKDLYNVSTSPSFLASSRDHSVDGNDDDDHIVR